MYVSDKIKLTNSQKKNLSSSAFQVQLLTQNKYASSVRPDELYYNIFTSSEHGGIKLALCYAPPMSSIFLG